jgi:hypothetical protein
MIKVKIDQPAPNIFYVEDGYTVSYADDVLEVLNEDDETIAVFRGWVYAMPADEVEEEAEEGSAESETLGGIEVVEADFLGPESASYVHVNSHGDHGSLDDETEAPTS